MLPARLEPAELALLHERLRHEVRPDREGRRAAGAWTTPIGLADLTVGPLLADRPATLLDPSCGAGMFLARAIELARRRGQPLPRVLGVDVDARAVDAARRVLVAALGPGADLEAVEASIVHADTLLADDLEARLGPAGAEGFDAVVGNPPFLFGETVAPGERDRLRARYQLATGAFDAYQLFVERGLELLGPHGRLAMVLPDAVLARDGAMALRQRCIAVGLSRVVHVGPAFRAGVAVCVVDVARARRERPVEVWTWAPGGQVRRRPPRPVDSLIDGGAQRLEVHASPDEHRVLSSLESRRRLRALALVHRGEELGKRDLDPEGTIPLRVGEDVVPFGLRPPTRGAHRLGKPAARYRGPKVVVVKTGRRPVAAVDETDAATLQSLYHLELVGPDVAPEVDPHAIAVLLNSRVLRMWVHRRFTAYKGLFPQLNQSTLADLPMPAPGPHWRALAAIGRRIAASVQDGARPGALGVEDEERVCEAYALAPWERNVIRNAVLP